MKKTHLEAPAFVATGEMQKQLITEDKVRMFIERSWLTEDRLKKAPPVYPSDFQDFKAHKAGIRNFKIL